MQSYIRFQARDDDLGVEIHSHRQAFIRAGKHNLFNDAIRDVMTIPEPLVAVRKTHILWTKYKTNFLPVIKILRSIWQW